MKIPRGLPGQKVVRALTRTGFYVRRQRSSHVIMRRDKPFAQVVVPLHQSIDTGTLDAIIDGAGLTVEEFTELV
ncbi:MAG: type II toxin-antitoxin system HicA family toxin [Candidatus Altiarchaeota archaeon]